MFFSMSKEEIDYLDPEQKIEVLEGLGDCYRELVDVKKARECYSELLSHDLDSGTRGRVLRKLVESTLGDEQEIWGRREAILLQAEACEGISDLDQAEILTCLAQTYQMNGDLEVARSHYERALSIFSSINGPPNRHALTLHCLGALEIQAGNIERARSVLSEAFEVVEKKITPFVNMELTLTLGEIEMVSGHYDHSMDILKKAEYLANQMGHHSEAGWTHAYSSIILFEMGSLEQSYAEAIKCLEQMLLLDMPRAIVGPKSLMALIEVELGNADEAERLIMEIEPLVKNMPTNLDSPNMALFYFIKGKYFGLIGDVSKCMEAFSLGYKMCVSKRLGKYYEGLGREWCSLCLKRFGKYDISNQEMLESIKIFDGLNNIYHSHRNKNILHRI